MSQRIGDVALARLWTRVEHRAQAVDPAGFGVDRDADRGPLARYPLATDASPRIDSLEAWGSNHNALLLVGEPGSGKTTELRRHYEELKRAGAKVLWIDLRLLTTQEALTRALFESDSYRDWAPGSYHLHIFLDGLDETPIGEQLGTIVRSRFDNEALRTARLFVRITSRAADLPDSLPEELGRVWGKERVASLALLPLSRESVQQAAAKWTAITDAQAFLERVANPPVSALAARPLTLEMLLDEDAAGLALGPRSRAQLFDRGLLRLAREPNKQRPKGRLTGEQRVAIARRLAAITLLTASTRIVAGDDEPLSGELHVRDASGGHERLPDSDVPATRENLHDTLCSALVIANGADNRFEWAHRSYQEALAAAWLAQAPSAALAALRRWLVRGSGGRERVVSQLRGLAVWLAERSAHVFDDLLRIDPDVLLDADPTAFTDERRAALVAALLEHDARNPVGWLQRRGRAAFNWLKHPGLAKQILGYLPAPAGTAFPEQVERIALEIAREAQLDEVLPTAVDLTLRASVADTVRRAAASMVAHRGDTEDVARLRPLVDSRDPELDGDLRGIVLQALLDRKLIAVREVLEHADHIDPRVADALKYLIVYELPQRAEPHELEALVDWVLAPSAREPTGGTDQVRTQLFDRLLERTCARLDDDHTRASAVRLLEYGFRSGGVSRLPPALRDARREDRRRLFAEIFRVAGTQKGAWWYASQWFDADDLDWIVTQCESAASSPERVQWSRVARAIFSTVPPERGPDAVAQLDAGRSRSSELAAETKDLWDGWSLDDEEVEAMRELEVERARAAQDRAEAIAQWQRSIDVAFASARTGRVEAWVSLIHLLGHGVNGSGQLVEGRSTDITESTWWAQASTESRAALLPMAERYLAEGDAQRDEWFGLDTWNPIPSATVAALRALQELDVTALERFPAQLWARWIPALLFASTPDSGPASARLRELLRLARDRSPRELEQALIRLLELDEVSGVRALRMLRELADARLARRVLDWAASVSPASSTLAEVLRFATRSAPDDARNLALVTVARDLRDDRDVDATSFLLSLSAARDWPDILKRFRAHPEFGWKTLFRNTTHSLPRFRPALTPDQLAELYEWMKAQPRLSAPRSERAAALVQSSNQGSRNMLEDAVFAALVDPGNDEAVRVLRGLAARHPDWSYLGNVIADVETRAAATSWKPPSVSEVLRLGVDAAPGESMSPSKETVSGDAAPREVTPLRALHDALLSAFPRRDDLAKLLRLEIGENLETIAVGESLSAITFRLIEWAEAHGRTGELLAGARRANPGNVALRALVGNVGPEKPRRADQGAGLRDGRNASPTRPPPGPIVHADDVQKDRWGGEAERAGRRLRAVYKGSERGLFAVDLIVESTDGSPLQGPVVFHLHDDFPRSAVHIKKIRDSRWAMCESVTATGVFVVGAQVRDSGGAWTGLEFDLGKLAGLPKRFRPR